MPPRTKSPGKLPKPGAVAASKQMEENRDRASTAMSRLNVRPGADEVRATSRKFWGCEGMETESAEKLRDIWIDLHRFRARDTWIERINTFV